MKKPIEPRLLEDAVRALDASATVSWPERTCARIALDPVHAELGIVRIELGGRVRRDRTR